MVKKKTMRFLWSSAIFICIMCVVIFSFLAFYMNGKSSGTMIEMGTIYMSGMSEQISNENARGSSGKPRCSCPGARLYQRL